MCVLTFKKEAGEKVLLILNPYLAQFDVQHIIIIISIVIW